jgi:hypothetical protein
MTRKKALLLYLLSGKAVSIRNAYIHLGISNPGREVARLIEKPFNIRLKRKQMNGKTKYGSHCYWFEYHIPVLTAKQRKEIKIFLNNES